MDKLLQSIKEGPLNPSSNDESSAVVNETSDEMNALLSKIIDKTENSDIQNNDNVGGDNDNNNLAVVNRTSEAMNTLLSKITDKTENNNEEMKDDEGGDNNKILVNNNNDDDNERYNNDDDDDSDFYFDYEEDEDDELPPPPNESDGEDLDPDEINKMLNNGAINDTINPDDEHTGKALQGDNFATESTVKKGEELTMYEKPTFDKTAMRKFEEQRKEDDPEGWVRKHGKDMKAQSRAGVVAQHGYLDEDDEEFKMDGDKDLFASLSKQKISLTLRLRRALYNCGVDKEKWNNYQWIFDLNPNPNGKNPGLRLGMLVLCNLCNLSFNVLGGEGDIGVVKQKVEGHIRVCGDDKCNCGCGYERATLQALLDKKGSRNRASDHFRHQDIKKDYTTMTEEIYYNGGKEKLEDERRGDKKISGDLRQMGYENIYWTKGTDERWQRWLENVSNGHTKVSRSQFDRLKKMEISLTNKEDAVFD